MKDEEMGYMSYLAKKMHEAITKLMDGMIKTSQSRRMVHIGRALLRVIRILQARREFTHSGHTFIYYLN